MNLEVNKIYYADKYESLLHKYKEFEIIKILGSSILVRDLEEDKLKWIDKEDYRFFAKDEYI